jgi:hypothetical protein
MIDKTYGHLVPDADKYVRRLLDDYDGRRSETGHGLRGRRLRG